MKEKYKKKKEQLVEEIIKVVEDKETENKYLSLKEKLMNYTLFCYKHNLEHYSFKLNERKFLNCSYIIESTPNLVCLDLGYEKEQKAINHLIEVIEKNKNGLVDGLTKGEAECILNYLVLKAREYLRKELWKCGEDILTNNLGLVDGFIEALTIYPLKEIGIKAILVEVADSISKNVNHSFGIITLPIKKENIIEEKSYLVDGSYRKFFSTINCTEASFFNLHERNGNKIGPDAGFYVCASKKGKIFAQTLLKQGFIEWTEEFAEIYIAGFVYHQKRYESNTLKECLQKKYVEITKEKIKFYMEGWMYQLSLNRDYSSKEYLKEEELQILKEKYESYRTKLIWQKRLNRLQNFAKIFLLPKISKEKSTTSEDYIEMTKERIENYMVRQMREINLNEYRLFIERLRQTDFTNIQIFEERERIPKEKVEKMGYLLHLKKNMK